MLYLRITPVAAWPTLARHMSRPCRSKPPQLDSKPPENTAANNRGWRSHAALRHFIVLLYCKSSVELAWPVHSHATHSSLSAVIIMNSPVEQLHTLLTYIVQGNYTFVLLTNRIHPGNLHAIIKLFHVTF